MNKYKRWHDAIIARAHSRDLDAYKERHHIVPRCLDGSDHPSNLVDLTYREHFLVHWLLTKLHEGRNKVRMVYAVHAMTLGLGPRNVGSWRIELAKRLLKEQALKRLAVRRRLKQQELDRRDALAQEVETGVFVLRREKGKITQAAKDWLSVNYQPPAPEQPSPVALDSTLRRKKKRTEWSNYIDSLRRLKRALRTARKANDIAAEAEIRTKISELWQERERSRSERLAA